MINMVGSVLIHRSSRSTHVKNITNFFYHFVVKLEINGECSLGGIDLRLHAESIFFHSQSKLGDCTMYQYNIQIYTGTS